MEITQPYERLRQQKHFLKCDAQQAAFGQVHIENFLAFAKSTVLQNHFFDRKRRSHCRFKNCYVVVVMLLMIIEINSLAIGKSISERVGAARFFYR